MIQTASHLRNLSIALCTLIAVLLLSGLGTAQRLAPVDVALSAPLQQTPPFTFVFNDGDSFEVTPGEQNTVSAILQTDSTVTETLNFTVTSLLVGNPSGWSIVSPNPLSVDNVSPGAPRTVDFIIDVPADATPGTVGFRATAETVDQFGNPLTVEANIDLVVPEPATPTPTPGLVDLQLVVRDEREKEDTPGSTVDYDLRITNRGDERVTIDLGIDDVVNCNRDIEGCSDSVTRSNITLDPNQSADFSVSVFIPSDANPGTRATTRVVAEVSNPTEFSTFVDVFTTVLEASPTPTRTETPSNTPSPTATLGPVCDDIFENDDDRGSARVIDVNLPQPQPERDPDIDDRRAICPAGDEDWLVFGGIAGKVYTIDVRNVAPGLDLTLTLYDEDGNEIAFNDDFYDRDPDAPDADDIDPRIQSWTAPYTGRYYLRVRDAADRGGVDRTYTIELIAESYGVTPETVIELCEDQFEQDGLPEQAKLITSNERQFDRRLCPTGDADWVTFFGKQDKRYFIYTDTRPYFQDNPVNDTIEVQAGADTVIVLTDRDGVSVLDVNDDIPGGETLDSQIEFIPEVDGFYYLQVKNVGDIGNQFIRYDLTLELCVPGTTECGRDITLAANSLNLDTSGSAPTLTPTYTPTTPTVIGPEEFSLDGTAIPTLTFTPEGQ